MALIRWMLGVGDVKWKLRGGGGGILEMTYPPSCQEKTAIANNCDRSVSQVEMNVQNLDGETNRCRWVCHSHLIQY